MCLFSRHSRAMSVTAFINRGMTAVYHSPSVRLKGLVLNPQGIFLRTKERIDDRNGYKFRSLIIES